MEHKYFMNDVLVKKKLFRSMDGTKQHQIQVLFLQNPSFSTQRKKNKSIPGTGPLVGSVRMPHPQLRASRVETTALNEGSHFLAIMILANIASVITLRHWECDDILLSMVCVKLEQVELLMNSGFLFGRSHDETKKKKNSIGSKWKRNMFS
jgi:hypothetical protein